MVICGQCESFVELVKDLTPSTSIQKLFNTDWAATWDELRDFLTLHFWANSLLDTPYWRHCRNDADISRLKPLLEFYRGCGPSGFARYLLNNTGSYFGIEGFLVMLVGNCLPYQNHHNATQDERQIMDRRRTQFKTEAATKGLTVEEALAYVKHPGWRWNLQ